MTSKPNVIIFRDDLFVGSETFIYSQAEALRNYVPHYLGSRMMSDAAFPSHRMILINRGRWLGKAQEALFKVGRVLPGLYSRLTKLRPVLMHAHFGPDAIRVIPLSEYLSVPLVVTFHGYDATTTDNYALRSFYKHRQYVRKRPQLKQQGRLFIAVSEFIKKKLSDQGFLPESVVVHYIGVDTKFFQPDPAVEREDIVLFTGRLIENKGCECLIKAMSIVQGVVPDVKLVVMGEGPLRASLERLAASTLKNYSFLGMQKPSTVRDLMNRAKVFSVPSITVASGASEGFGIVFSEAQAMGLPVVSFRTGGIPEAVSHGETGFLVPERDVEGLAKNIIHLMERRDLWRQFSEHGKKRVEQKFNLVKQTASLEKIYETALRNPGL